MKYMFILLFVCLPTPLINLVVTGLEQTIVSAIIATGSTSFFTK